MLAVSWLRIFTSSSPHPRTGDGILPNAAFSIMASRWRCASIVEADSGDVEGKLRMCF